MTTALPVPICKPDPDASRLVDVLGVEHVALLLELLEQVQSGTGYGDITIVLAGGHVQNVKLTQSFRAEKKGNGAARYNGEKKE